MSDKRLPFGPVTGHEVSAYEPSWRDVIASWFMGDQKASPEKERLVSGIFGSTGLGPTGPGVVDFTPFGVPLAIDEYKRAQTPTDAAFAAMGFVPGAKGVAQGVKAVADDAAKGIRAYHGSPHDFDRFSLDKIGTGEGAQAYGHGLYFAEAEDTAKSYRDSLAQTIKVNGNPIVQANRRVGTTGDTSVDDLLSANNGDLEAAIAEERAFLDEMRAQGRPAADDTSTLQKLEALRGSVDSKNTGRMYEVRINADPESFLDWDKPLSAHSEAVQSAILPHLRNDWISSGNSPSSWLEFGEGQAMHNPIATAINRVRGDPAAASQALREAGIPGIKYLDQGSRGAGEGSRNYVVFDDALVEILRKYGIALPFGLGAAGAGALSQGEPEVY